MPEIKLSDLRLTIKQASLLRQLPDSPSDGKRCKGPKRVIANNLTDKGYAQMVGRSWRDIGYFVRTEAGEAAQAEFFRIYGEYP